MEIVPPSPFTETKSLTSDREQVFSSVKVVPGNAPSDDSGLGIPMDVLNEWMRAYDAFDALNADNEKGKLNVTQIYAVLNLHAPKEYRVEWSLLDELFDHLDKGTGTCDRLMFEQLIQMCFTKERRRARLRNTVGLFVISLFTFLFWPLMAPLAWPTLRGRVSRVVRYVIRQFVVFSFSLPFSLRSQITTNRALFSIFYLLITAIYTLGIGNIIMAVYFFYAYFERNISFIEPAIEGVLYITSSFILSGIIALNDTDSFLSIEQVMQGLHFHQTQVIANPPGDAVLDEENPSAAVLDQGPDAENLKAVLNRARTVEDLLMLVLYVSPSERRASRWMRAANWWLAFCATFLMAFAPFVVRAYYGDNLIGTCPTSVCQRYDPAYRAIAVDSFILNFIFVYWTLSMLLGTYFHFIERAKWMSRLHAMLIPEEAALHRMPYLSMEEPQNVIAWDKLRITMVNFKSTDLKRIQIILGGVAVLVLLLLPLILYQRIKGFPVQIDQGVIYVTSAYLMAVIGGYLVYPALYRGMQINAILDDFLVFFSNKAYRLCVKANQDVHINDEDRKRLTLCQNLCAGIRKYMLQNPTYLTLFGVAINQTLFVSVATATVGSLWTWLSSYL